MALIRISIVYQSYSGKVLFQPFRNKALLINVLSPKQAMVVFLSFYLTTSPISHIYNIQDKSFRQVCVYNYFSPSYSKMLRRVIPTVLPPTVTSLNFSRDLYGGCFSALLKETLFDELRLTIFMRLLY